jgi:hypothetical protein
MHANRDLRVLLKWLDYWFRLGNLHRYPSTQRVHVMIARDELPEDPKDWRAFIVELPRLTPDDAESCPMPVSELLEYVDMESSEPDTATTNALTFLRTAATGGSKCWIWSYAESDGELCYVTYRQTSDGSNIRGMSSASPEYDGDFQLTPEQYLLAEQYDLVYW